MNLKTYLKDKYINILISIITLILTATILLIFKINIYLIIMIITILIINYLIILSYSYLRKKSFYNNLDKCMSALDQKYLITEIIKEPNFLEGELLVDYLYDIDKSMIERINKYKYSSNDFKDYLELWCHEIKTPISTSKLIIENNKNKTTNSINEELEKIDNYVEQVLYYARSENVEKDYLIVDTDIKKVVEKVIKKNKKSLITKKIKVIIKDLYNVKSDSKWLEYIINQIIINCIKYSKNKDASIEISMKKNKNNKFLYIKDNGIGIEANEIERVFDKGFTGTNGRKIYSSTGIGLYLCKKLCQKLGCDISISSKLNQETTITIVFPESHIIEDIR